MANIFSERHALNWRFVAEWGQWLVWDGQCWRPEKTYRAFDLARLVCREAALRCRRPNKGAKLAATSTVAAVERLARADRRHAANNGLWDQGPLLLNTPAGIVDLRTGQAGRARPDAFITKMTYASAGDGPPKAPNEPALPPHCRWFISSEFTKVCRKAGIADFVFHCLRHSFAARLLGRGVPIYKVSKILGHSGVQVTEQHYGLLNQADLHGAISAVRGIMSEPFAADLQQSPNPALQIAQ